MLYYGVLSSRVNVDLLAESTVARLRKRLGVSRLHAAELRNATLAQVSGNIVALQKKLDLRFDFYRVAKPDHAIICFFDQVFDHGVNPAITWTGYWTPLRYVLLLKVAVLFDDDLAQRAWTARIELDNKKAEECLVTICRDLQGRVGSLPDARSQQLIGDALSWAEHNPGEICYNVRSQEDLLQITPNVIGFQSVMHGIAMRIRRHRREAIRIVVDQQTQFNKAQRTFAEFCTALRSLPAFSTGPGLPEIDFSRMPTIPISFASGTDSAGLELVDIYLWVFKRYLEERDVAAELIPLIKRQSQRGRTDEISINALTSRWSHWFEELPEPSEDQIKRAKELMAMDEERRREAVRKLPGRSST